MYREERIVLLFAAVQMSLLHYLLQFGAFSCVIACLFPQHTGLLSPLPLCYVTVKEFLLWTFPHRTLRQDYKIKLKNTIKRELRGKRIKALFVMFLEVITGVLCTFDIFNIFWIPLIDRLLHPHCLGYDFAHQIWSLCLKEHKSFHLQKAWWMKTWECWVPNKDIGQKCRIPQIQIFHQRQSNEEQKRSPYILHSSLTSIILPPGCWGESLNMKLRQFWYSVVINLEKICDCKSQEVKLQWLYRRMNKWYHGTTGTVRWFHVRITTSPYWFNTFSLKTVRYMLNLREWLIYSYVSVNLSWSQHNLHERTR